MLRKVLFFLCLAVATAIVVYHPVTVAEPGASPQDPAHEDLTRVEYPSLAKIPWKRHFIRPEETLESLFGKDWVYVARFNRIDRRHVYPGMTIKVPLDMAACRSYTPLPAEYPPAQKYEKYILIDLTEQWMGAYEHGKLKFSMPAATGATGHETPTGLFQIDARDQTHSSSLYKTEDQSDQYPMDNAMRFHVGADNVSYWIHARDLPGKPASHGCVGLYDEGMQNRVYGVPTQPVLLDSEKMYEWAVGENDFEDDPGSLEEIEDAPMVEVRGSNPRYM
ncbi:L,D-transpeptidase [Geomesophilobacter sediminis]|uniref:L,D-transpeptidase n=1 Tax=Geomesophilobacter sediminis TaxID=2798584 RepID=A0A8J7M181_9BACT|nr:L,D-transpeptidase [Geomesophilobacter sediminis]MBJ6726788.1 L,D-transpeptidase [Geomesophilobacter sediminis]